MFSCSRVMRTMLPSPKRTSALLGWDGVDSWAELPVETASDRHRANAKGILPMLASFVGNSEMRIKASEIFLTRLGTTLGAIPGDRIRAITFIEHQRTKKI